QGTKLSQEFVIDAPGDGELAARAWAEVAVASLQALNDPKLDPVITAYCQRYGIGSRCASFLVLENENDYKRLNLEEERGRRLPGYRLLDLGQAAEAVRLFQRVQRQRPFEPHSYRDLARSLEECERYGAAAVQYEIVLAGKWHSRFRDDLKTVVCEEYARMMQE